jgi:aspartyl-tRNA(Asn)/glutamyl-tRNA(Gln) amidotransferase subunit A
MGLASVGTDTGGSVRIPAAACGIVGLKPSAGEVPVDGVIALSPSLDHVGPLARTVQDAAWVYAVMAGRPPETIAPSALGAMRLKRLTGYFAAPLEPIVRAAFEEAVRRLAHGGVNMLEAEMREATLINNTYVDIVLPEAAHVHAPYLDRRAADYTATVRSRIELGRAIPAVAYLAAQTHRAALTAAVDHALDDCDALVLPTLPLAAPPLGIETVTIDPRSAQTTPVRSAMLKHTQLFNLTGHPAISIPIATETLPVGLQLVGRRNATMHLLEVAAACEGLLSP